MRSNITSLIFGVIYMMSVYQLVNLTYQLFSYRIIPEVAHDFCEKKDVTDLLEQLLKRHDDLIFININYNEAYCSTYNLKEHSWIPTSRTSSWQTSVTADGNLIVFHFPRRWSPEYNASWLTSPTPYTLTIEKGTAGNPYTIEREVGSRRKVDLEGVYYVGSVTPTRSYEKAFVLRPAPYTDELVSQIKCMRQDTWQIRKRLTCFKAY